MYAVDKISREKILSIKLCFRRSAQVVCPEHTDAHLIEDYHAGDMICSECGLVVGDRFDIFIFKF